MWNKFPKRIITTVSGFLVLAAGWGIVSNIDLNIAKASNLDIITTELEQVEKRLDEKILQDRIDSLEKTIFEIESRWRNIYYKEFEEVPDMEELNFYVKNKSLEAFERLVDKREELKEKEAELKKLQES